MADPSEVEILSSAMMGGEEAAPAEVTPPAEEAPVEETPPETPAEETPAEEAPAAEQGEEEPPEPGAEEEPPAEAEETPEQKMEAARAAAEEKTLTEMYRENPQLKEFLKQQGNEHLRFAFFRASEINKIFPTVAVAKEAHESAVQLAEIDSMYFGGTPETQEQLLDYLLNEDMDSETGQHQGNYADLLHAATSRMMMGYFESKDRDPQILAQAAANIKMKPEELHAMLQLVGTAFGLKGFSLDGAEPAAKPGAPAGKDPRFQREQENFQREKQEFEQSRQKEFVGGIQTEMKTWAETEIGNRLKQATALAKNPGLTKILLDQVRHQVATELDGDKLHSAKVQQVMRSGKRGPELRGKIVALLQQRARQAIPSVVSRVLKEAGLVVQQKATEKDTKRQQAAGRKEPSTTGTPGRPATRPEPKTTGGPLSRQEQVELLKQDMGG